MTTTCLSPVEADPNALMLYEKIGSGAHCNIHRALDSNGRLVAVKSLKQESLDDIEQLLRLRSEFTILEALDHPNIVRPVRCELERSRIVLELIQGTPLDQTLSAFWSLERVARIGQGIVSALEEVHRWGVHREIKPGNVLLSYGDKVTLVDFGLAIAPGLVENLDRKGVVMGTPAYYSPEQALGKELTPASDIFSLASLLFHLLTETTPFHVPKGCHRPDISMGVAIVNDEPRSLGKVRSNAAPMERLINKMLRKMPSDRPSLPEVQEALARWASPHLQLQAA